MSDAYDKISKIWSKFPKEFENTTLHDDVINLQTTFENRKYFFGDYLTKIVIIGNMSTGKSTLINTLLGKEYFGTIETHGTVSFFYCSLSQKNYEYFTVNNCPIEYKEIESLKNSTRLNVFLPDYFDQNSVIKAYVKHDKSKILEKKTVIVDCPGFAYDEITDKEVKNHCSNADICIFMFQINEPATLNQGNFIKSIRNNFKNPTFFFVYNKCDLNNFNDEKKTTLSENFINLFGEEYFNKFKLSDDPLYFISANEKLDKYEDLSRLKKDILSHKNVHFIRFVNFLSILFNETNKICKTVGSLITQERRLKTTKLKSFDEMKKQTKHVNEKYSELQNHVKRCIESCKRNLQINKIFDLIFRTIVDSNETCTKENASQMVSMIEENIRNKVIGFIENNLHNLCIDPINKQIQEINNDNPTGIIMSRNIDYHFSSDQLNIPHYDNVKNIFWPHERGDKTTKVKEAYAEFIKGSANKKEINESIIKLYNHEFAEIEEEYLKLVECTKKKINTKENLMKAELQEMENKLEILSKYEKKVNKNVKNFNSTLI